MILQKRILLCVNVIPQVYEGLEPFFEDILTEILQVCGGDGIFQLFFILYVMPRLR